MTPLHVGMYNVLTPLSVTECILMFQHILDESTDPWGIKVERVEM